MFHVIVYPEGVGGRVTVGEALAEARTNAGLSVDEVSERTRIRQAVIRGIEQDDYDACGGDLFVRGYLRVLADAIGIDAQPLIREYDQAHPSSRLQVQNVGTLPPGPGGTPQPGPDTTDHPRPDTTDQPDGDGGIKSGFEGAVSAAPSGAAQPDETVLDVPPVAQAPVPPVPPAAAVAQAPAVTTETTQTALDAAASDPAETVSDLPAVQLDDTVFDLEPVPPLPDGLPAAGGPSAADWLPAGEGTNAASGEFYSMPADLEAVFLGPGLSGPGAAGPGAAGPGAAGPGAAEGNGVSAPSSFKARRARRAQARPPTSGSVWRVRVRGWRWVTGLAVLVAAVLAIVVVATSHIVSSLSNGSGKTTASSATANTRNAAPKTASSGSKAATSNAAGSTAGTSPSPSASSSPASNPAANAPTTVLPIRQAQAFGPDGVADGDNPEAAMSAITPGSPTPWHTDWYATAQFGSLQKGTGLLLDMGQTVTVSSVSIHLGASPGADLQLRAGNTPAFADLSVVDSTDNAGGVVQLHLSTPVQARYLLIWFTQLPPSAPGQYQASVYSVAVTGQA